jgi:uncharacterized protein
MTEPILFAGFILGIVGSAHCIGMCGPLVLAFPSNTQKKSRLILSRLMYHLSRSAAYAVMGFILGVVGFGFSLAGIQQYVSLLAGLIMLSLVLIPAKKRSFFMHATFIKMPASIKGIMQRLMKSDGFGAMMSLGFLNGLLPCGFVYLGLAGAVGMGSSVGSAAFMFLFGLGTLPVMLLVSILPGFQSVRLKERLNFMFPYITAIIALLLILRGLGLGIPFLSPDLVSGGMHSITH